MCAKHKARENYHGDASVSVRPTYGSGRSPHGDGYMRVWCPGHPTAHKDGYAFEHRKVMWDAGLLDDLSLHVHHINGDKSDNRIENLVVMDEGEHHRLHVRETGFVTNQYGDWPLRTDPGTPT